MAQLNISLFEIVLILVSVRAVGLIFRRIGQPQVVGEMFAGLVLGPSLLGRFAPNFFSFCFPEDSMDVLFTLSRLGVWLFMFLVGAELDMGKVRRVGKTVLVISQTSILVPLAMGAVFALVLFPRFAGSRIKFFPFALFMGVAMSITAFPVLARILKERGLEKEELGIMATACAAVNDVAAWCLLAAMILVVHATTAGWAIAIRLATLIAYISAMWFLVRPLLVKWTRTMHKLDPEFFAMILLLLFVSCLTAQGIGVHALFGAFLFGVSLPKSEWLVDGLRQKIEPVTAALLLPLFFAFTGIRTDIGLISTGKLWIMCASVVGISVLGKFLGTSLPARWLGQSWGQASALGALMNTRGLMELVILNIGLDLGVISPVLFSMMVVMALVTTFMTSPWLDLSIGKKAAIARNA